jgi:ABC-type dipeptide/oligopeptide/nickel transport system ATPase component
MQTNPIDNDVQLEFKDLRVHFFTDEGVVKAVDGVDFNVRKGKTLCIVGESGCGKSVMSLTAMRIVQKPGRIVSGEMLWHNADGGVTDLVKLDANGSAVRKIRGAQIAMIFQEPMTSLSALHTVGKKRATARLKCCARCASRAQNALSMNILSGSPVACASAS